MSDDEVKPNVYSLFDERLKAQREARADEPRFEIRWAAEVLQKPTTPRWLLRDKIEAGVIALMSGPRGSYKSFIAMDWALRVAMAGSQVLVISAEGAGFDRRLLGALTKHAPDLAPEELALAVIEQRVNFYDAQEISALHATIEGVSLEPALIVIDTLSKNSGALDENNNSEAKVFIGFLDGIRRQYGCTILVLHHTGHSEKGRARGASALEADTDAAYVITRNGTERSVSVSRERFKDSADLPPLTYQAEVIDLQRSDDDGLPISTLALVADNSEAPLSLRAPPRSSQQRQFLRMLADLQVSAQASAKGDLVWTILELRELARGSGLAKSTARDVVAIATQHYLMATIGGYRLLHKDEK